MSTPEARFHHRLSRAEDKLRRAQTAPTLPKYDLTAVPSNNLLVTVGEIGSASSTTLSDTLSMTVDFEDVRATDMIWVMCMAPPVYTTGAPVASVYQIQDTQSHFYTIQPNELAMEAGTPLPNAGAHVTFFATAPPEALPGLVAGVDTITATWDNPVYDRFMQAWLIRFEPNIPLSWPFFQTSDANFSSDRTLLTVPFIGEVNGDRSLLFALLISISAPARSIAYGGVVGYNGFYESSGSRKGFTSSRQDYTIHQQTSGANAYVVAGSVPQSYEIDQGTYMTGDIINSFNGAAQAYSDVPSLAAAFNFWKGGILFYITN